MTPLSPEYLFLFKLYTDMAMLAIGVGAEMIAGHAGTVVTAPLNTVRSMEVFVDPSKMSWIADNCEEESGGRTDGIATESIPTTTSSLRRRTLFLLSPLGQNVAKVGGMVVDSMTAAGRGSESGRWR